MTKAKPKKTVPGWIILRAELPAYPFPTEEMAKAALKNFVDRTIIVEAKLPKSAGFK